MLRPTRRHRQDCAQYGRFGTDCPAKAKNKCPFIVHWYENGKRRERALNTNDERVAWELVNRMVVENQGQPDAPPKTVEQAIHDYLASEKTRGIAESTLKSFRKFLCGNSNRNPNGDYSLTLLQYATKLGIHYLRDISPDLADKLRGHWKLKGRARIVQDERYKQFFRHMHETGVIPTNPTAGLKSPTVVIEPVVAFDREQREALLDAVKGDQRLLAANLVMKYTGLAPVDLVHLGPQKLRGHYIVTRRVKTRKNQKGKGRLLKIKLPDPVVERLRNLKPYPCGLWFWNQMGESKHETATGNLRRKMRPYFKGAKVWLKDEDGNVVYGDNGEPELGFLYQWRHTFVHTHLMKRTPIERIAELIGDTVHTVMENYAHFIEERQKGLDESQENTFDADELVRLAVKSSKEDEIDASSEDEIAA